MAAGSLVILASLGPPGLIGLIRFYMCGKFADILATETAHPVNFIFRLIKNMKTKITTFITEKYHSHHGSQFKVKISSVKVPMKRNFGLSFYCLT